MSLPQALETDTSMDEETSKLTKQLQDLLSSENNK
ncbi:YER093C-Ap-like protein [Saccharomyces cerevisiae AWRI1631]|nr:YER093C-Ap-like protein [Saccharomyces cerevisiae AWRI1631]